ARKLPVLTPLLALLLAREGLPVLVHGMRTEARRVLSSDVLVALDIQALIAPEKIANGQVAHLATGTLLPGLARLLAVREVVGLRNPAHSVVKLMNPCQGPAVVVSSYTHPEYLDKLSATLGLLGMTALLSRGLEGEVCADPRRSPRYDAFVQGQHQALDEQQAGTATEVPGLPTAIDVDSTAHYTRQVLAGQAPLPPALARQVQHIVWLAEQAAAGAQP
ncbi:MAG: DNA-binding protein YbiB, partial [Burkholderiaceae bacterium]|nr:DNA-binding protein YbiB [Burkholderiaceae bacterium]